MYTIQSVCRNGRPPSRWKHTLSTHASCRLLPKCCTWRQRPQHEVRECSYTPPCIRCYTARMSCSTRWSAMTRCSLPICTGRNLLAFASVAPAPTTDPASPSPAVSKHRIVAKWQNTGHGVILHSTLTKSYADYVYLRSGDHRQNHDYLVLLSLHVSVQL